MLAAVAQNGNALQYASEDLKADKDVVLAAVMQDGFALCFTSKDLKDCNEIVLVAVAQDCDAVRFASDNLRKDGLRAYINSLALARRSLLFFLLAARYRPPLHALEPLEAPAPPHARSIFVGCVLNKLNDHGIYFAMKLKRLIAAFAGAPVGHMLTTLRAAACNLQ